MKPRQARALVHRVERATLDALAELNPLPAKSPRLLVAVSGGADSSAALLALAERAGRHDWELQAVHVDHGIADAPTRAAFQAAAADLAQRLGVPFCVEIVDVPAVAEQQGLSLETAARQERYAALARVARDGSATAVVTGHTADDQAESVLLHLIRGSGLDGLTGMAVLGQTPTGAPVPLIRPLLALCRAETRALCLYHQIEVVDDPSNDDARFTRNRVRAEVVPILERLNPKIVEMLGNLADNIRPDRDLLDQLTREALEQTATDVGESEVHLSRKALTALPVALQLRVLRHVLSRSADPPSRERTLAVQRLALSGGHRIECGGGVVAEARGDSLRIWWT